MGVAGIVGLLVVAWAIFTFNRLIRLRQLGDNAWSDIDVQLKRRHDLIPNVVAVVQGHAGYEKGTLEAVVAARGRALQASQAGPATRAREEDPLGNALQRVLGVAEAYPELKAAASFASLQSTLIDVEEHLQNARRYYNAVVRDFNIAIAQFPAGIIAGMMRLQPREFFGLDDASERAVPKVPLVLLFLALSGTGLSAQRSYSIERFDARIRVNRDASIDVTETIAARFVGSYNGLYRTIPVVYHGAQGLNWTIRLMLQSARDNAGHDLRTETSHEGASVKYKIWIPGATNAERTIVLRYHATNALRFFDEHDELYWNVTGDQWDVPIRRASAEIELPRGAPGGRPEIEVAAGTPGVRAIAYNGVYGSTTRDAKVTISDTVIRLAMPHRLDFHEGLTAVVGWDKGLVTRPTAMDRAMELAGSNWPFLIPIPVFLIAFMRWSRRGRDPRRRPVTVLYEPPAGITPAEAGTLIDHSVDMRDITATLMDLAVRGYIRIEEQENPKLLGLFGGGTDYTLHRLKASEGLKPHELAVFNGVFGKDDVFESFSANSTMSLSVSVDGKEISPPSTGGGTSRQRVPVEELNQRFYRHLNPIRNAIWDQLIDSGFYRKRPEQARQEAMRLGCALPLVIAIAGSLLSPFFLLTPVPFILAALVSALILYIFAQLMPSRTEPGTRALEQVLGFEEFLRRVDSEHTQAIVGHPEVFDKCLPYAMAFGVDQQFARAFEGIYKEPPGWYVGPSVTDFNVRNLSRRVTHLETFLRTTMTSTPRSVGTTWYSSGASGGGSSSSPSWSFGSGFGGGGKSGGGGFSGGGGGGGGGGVARSNITSLLLLLALTPPQRSLAAQEKSYSIQRCDAAVRVNKDASIDVTETITARFVGSWNGLYRTIPVAYRTSQGLNWTLGVALLGAQDQSTGQNLRTETSRQRHDIKYKIWIPGAANADRTIVLRYHATNGLRFFDEHDELYWNVTGDAWEVPIQVATAEIELPVGTPGIRAIAFNGVYGSGARDATVAIDGNMVRVAMPHALGYHEGLTVVVGWDKGVVAQPSAAARAAATVSSNWPLLLPIPVFLLAFWSWWRRGRDPRRRPIAVQYEPPAGITPAEAGTLLDNSADMRDVTATMIDLAVRGQLRIEEHQNPKLFGLFGGGTEYSLHRLKPVAADYGDGMALHESKVYTGIFLGHNEVVPLAELKDDFYKHLPGIRDAIFDALTGNGFYRNRPDKVKQHWIGAAVGIGVLVGVGGTYLSKLTPLTPVPFVIAAVVSALILIAFAQVMPARTEAGARALEHILGFEEFLRRVESEQFKRVIIGHPELFDKYLPFAMAFGVERQFARAFEGIYTQPPQWYVGPSIINFNVTHFSSSMSHLGTVASTTMSSSPRSSSGSGFGGGGSSGGGGGGGGGGAF